MRARRVATGLPASQRRLLAAAAGLYAVGTAMNAASPSRTERLLWTPVAAGLAASLWVARRGTSPPR